MREGQARRLLGLGQVARAAEVIGADPDGVDGLGGRVVQGGLAGDVADPAVVLEEGRDLGLVDARAVGGDGRVVADGAADGVVVDVHIGVLLDVLGPYTTACGSLIVLCGQG